MPQSNLFGFQVEAELQADSPRAKVKLHRPRARPCRLSPSEVRTLVRYRDGYRCRECGMTDRQHVRKYRKKLDVHRVNPGAPYAVRECVTLCRACHGNKPKSETGTRTAASGNVSMVLNLDPELRAALDLYIQETRPSPSLTGAVSVALQDFLRAKGFWSPRGGKKTP